MSLPDEDQTAPDAQLIQGVARGDRRALAALYDRHAAILFGIALRILRRNSEAEEVLREVFLEIWRRAGGFDERRGQISSWLTLLARRCALDRLRGRGPRAGAVAAEHDPGDWDSEDGVSLGEVGITVRHALAEMSEDQRAVLMRAYFQGLTQSEIAERLGKPLATVKTDSWLGLARLREILSAAGEKR